jgi:hypothetical protein
MMADEIRKMLADYLTGRIDGTLDEEGLRNLFLGEIAAQLAEMNEQRRVFCGHRKDRWLCALEPGHPGDHQNYHSSGGVVGWAR